jgi:hypothetical protein
MAVLCASASGEVVEVIVSWILSKMMVRLIQLSVRAPKMTHTTEVCSISNANTLKLSVIIEIFDILSFARLQSLLKLVFVFFI